MKPICAMYARGCLVGLYACSILCVRGLIRMGACACGMCMYINPLCRRVCIITT